MGADDRPVLVTSALPYANGSIHLGHLVEYIQTDIFVRFLRLIGRDVVYLCADDTHGTPIQLAARQAGIPPEELIARYPEEHQRDFRDFGITFDDYYTTHSPENRRRAREVFSTLRDAGHIVTREVDQFYCEQDAMFLPDRFIRGTCPQCGAREQYGDACEACGTHYETERLVDPRCATCGVAPVRRSSRHYFFKLADFTGEIDRWVSDPAHLQDETRKWSLNWIRDGLRDWDISRDAPYFGFEVPGESDKYLYVWLDAPIGYISTTEHFCTKTGRSFERYWRTEDADLYHFIGKDITYFHTIFWPAVLTGAGYRLPSKIFVHGFLTVNGDKMSKSRGTFITARHYLRHLDPECLRFYYASKLTGSIDDLDLNLDDFVSKINADLVNKIVNLASRIGPLLSEKLEGRVGSMDTDGEYRFRQLIAGLGTVQADYLAREFARVVRFAVEAAESANKVVQERAPWALVKSDPEAARRACAFAVHALKLVATVLKPVTPRVSSDIAAFLNHPPLEWADSSAELPDGHRVGPFTRLVERLAPSDVSPLSGTRT